MTILVWLERNADLIFIGSLLFVCILAAFFTTPNNHDRKEDQ